MELVYNLNPELVSTLDLYREWITRAGVQTSLASKLNLNLGKLFAEGKGAEASSLEDLMKIDHENHRGTPSDTHGYNLDYKVVKQNRKYVDASFFDEIREINRVLDDKLQVLLGARTCALKMFYPAGGYIDWHTNWDVPGYNIIFTYSPTGKGYWRHIDSAGATSVKPNPEKLVHIDDVPGWHCKMGYFGRKGETDRVVWHAAHTFEPRITISYLIYERSLWESLREELQS